MNTSDFDYNLPKDFIAQNPVVPRDSCKLMLYDSVSDEVEHKRFFDLVNILRDGDVLVLNRSKVIPARIIFELNSAEKEIFLLKKKSPTDYIVLLKPARFFKLNKKVAVSGDVEARVLVINDDGTRLLRFSPKNPKVNLDLALEKLGKAPLPPYIDNSKATFAEYQTIYAKEKGSCAAPTAGLHFTKKLLNSLKKKGVQVAEIILHVGLGTFLPVKVDKIEEHRMHSEEFVLSSETAAVLNLAKKEKRRIVAVGTTSVRVLETCFSIEEGFLAGAGETDIFIYPSGKNRSYKWKAVDALITNYHLPKSTLLMLVSSFLENKGIVTSTKKLFELYELALKNDYRFYSFGDAMMVI